MKTGLLLINLGSPDAPEPRAVARYLREFLGDKHVITLPAPLRWLLVNAIIAPFRSKKSAHAYQQIWTEAGSPLVVTSRRLATKVGALLADRAVVALGMRYGNPTIELAFQELKAAGVGEVVVLPLYPQFAASSTVTAVEEALRVGEGLGFRGKIRVIEQFFAYPAFIESVASRTRQVLTDFQPQHLVISFHGLPNSAIGRACGSAPSCLASMSSREAECAEVGLANERCYRAHSYATARALVASLGLERGAYTVSFQSRLSQKWIRPFTDEVIAKLALAKIKRVAVVCPSFVADCLETLEEIAMRLAEDFRAAGGEELRLVPCPNDGDDFAKALSDLVAIPPADRSPSLGSSL